jgi:hypothetical protein
MKKKKKGRWVDFEGASSFVFSPTEIDEQKAQLAERFEPAESGRKFVGFMLWVVVLLGVVGTITYWQDLGPLKALAALSLAIAAAVAFLYPQLRIKS